MVAMHLVQQRFFNGVRLWDHGKNSKINVLSIGKNGRDPNEFKSRNWQ
jgi:hypothetical protein